MEKKFEEFTSNKHDLLSHMTRPVNGVYGGGGGGGG